MFSASNAQNINNRGLAQTPIGLSARAGNDSAPAPALTPKATYDGGYADAKNIRLRIANGGAGQSGLIGAWADAFIKYCVEDQKLKPFRVRF